MIVRQGKNSRYLTSKTSLLT